MKKCSRCHKRKSEDEFNQKDRGRRRQSHCRACQRIYFQAYYTGKARRRCLDRLAADKKRNTEANTALLDSLKSKPCTDCGGTFKPWQMDFDHVRGKKRWNVAFGRRSYNQEAVLAEVAKCELVCSNCHRDRTYRRAHS